MNHAFQRSHAAPANFASGTLSPLALQAATHTMRTLAPGQACTLRPSRAGELRIVRGAVWATKSANALPAHVRDMPPDLFLGAGDRLPLRAGQRLVLEPLGRDGAPASAVAFHWCEHADASAWSTAVAGPAQDLRRALLQAAHAGTALARGVLRWALGTRGPHCAADGTRATSS